MGWLKPGADDERAMVLLAPDGNTPVPDDQSAFLDAVVAATGRPRKLVDRVMLQKYVYFVSKHGTVNGGSARPGFCCWSSALVSMLVCCLAGWFGRSRQQRVVCSCRCCSVCDDDAGGGQGRDRAVQGRRRGRDPGDGEARCWRIAVHRGAGRCARAGVA
jgi:hypothetical protein